MIFIFTLQEVCIGSRIEDILVGLIVNLRRLPKNAAKARCTMNFSNFLDQAWADHSKDPAGVAARLHEGQALISSEEDLSEFAGLASHVFVEHLGLWDQAVQFLSALKSHSTFSESSEAARKIDRAIRALELSNGQNPDLSAYSVSDRVRILAFASSTLSKTQPARSHDLLRTALRLAETGLTADDPANKSLAATGNNLACQFEEKSDRTAEETSLMILSAQTGRIYWERAGTWVEVMRAEYRLAMTFLAMQDFDRARRHAEISLAMATENKADALDKFFAFEALAQIEKKANAHYEWKQALAKASACFEQLSVDDKVWCKPILDKLMVAADQV